MARPRVALDLDQIRKLAALDCTNTEIAAVVGVSIDTLERRARKAITDGREEGKASLRRKQWEIAMKGNPTMLIWLGKQRLGQTDKQSIGGDGAQQPIRHVIEVVREKQTLNRIADVLQEPAHEPNGNGNGRH